MRCVVIAVMLASSVAWAQPEKLEAEAAARDGQQRYQAREYLLAAERFQRAYDLDPDPAYLFNLAQAYRLGNACAKSAAAYRELLGIVTTGPNVEKVEQYIVQMDACAKQQEPIAPTPPSAPPIEAPPLQPVERGGSAPLFYSGVGVTMLGAVGLVVGVLSMRRVAQIESDREQLCRPTCLWMNVKDRAEELDGDGERYQRRMLIGYVGGGIALAGGIVMMLLSRERSVEAQPMAAIVPADGGAMAFGTFAF